MGKRLNRKALKMETIRKVLKLGEPARAGLYGGDVEPILIAAAKDCRGRGLSMMTLNEWRSSDNWAEVLAYMYTIGGGKKTIARCFEISPFSAKRALLELCYERRLVVPLELIEEVAVKWRYNPYPLLREAAAKCAAFVTVPRETLREWVFSNNDYLLAAALYASGGADCTVALSRAGTSPTRIVVPESWVMLGTASQKQFVAEAAVALLPSSLFMHPGIMKWWRTGSEWAREAMVRRVAEITGGQSKLLALALNDPSAIVACAAEEVTKQKSAGVAPLRTVDILPEAVVYQKCLNGVIVGAKIPLDAEIRGYSPAYVCKADRAEIVEIHGDFFGEKVGISARDLSTQYRVGDVIEISDFDDRDDAGAGFYFWCSRELAEKND